MTEVADAVENPQQAARRLAAASLAQGFNPEALHTYTSPSGEPLFWRLRLKHPRTGDKRIFPMWRDASGRFVMKEPPAPPSGKPLYRLHELAQRPDDVVLVVEGEKAADAINKRGCLAATSGSASSAAAADWTPLKGRRVLIWPDNDEPGQRYAADVVQALRGIAAEVSVIDVAALNLPPHGDAVEWLAAHPEAGADDVLSLPALPAAAGPSDAAPQPLPDALPPVEPFDLALLPDALRDWVADVAERVSCPVDYVAVPAVVAACAVLGRKIALRPQQHGDWAVVPNVWGLVIGRPGMMKSPAMAAALAPLRRLAAEAQERYEAELSDWRRADKLREMQAEAAEKKAREELRKNPHADVLHLLGGDEAEPEPALRRYTTSNATMEALSELLRQNPQGLLLERDEIMGLLRELDRPERADFRAFLLEAWDGNGQFTVDRIGRGFNLHVPAMCLSVIGTTQPGRIGAYLSDALRGGAADDGLMQRFALAVWPDATGEWQDVDRWPDGKARRRAFDAYARLDHLDPQAAGAQQDTDPDGNPTGLPYLRLAPDALAVFAEWRAQLEARLRSGELHPAMEAHLAKYRKLVPGLALVFHLIEGDTGAVSEAAMLRALAWASYLESHARRIYGGAVAPEVAAARAILNRIKRGDLPREGFSSRDVWRPGWAGLDDSAVVADALDYLVELGWLSSSTKHTGGRPSTTYTLAVGAAL
jgi:putative DNA primase/helicase